MEGTATWNKLALEGSHKRYTFFAPHDRAFTNVSEQQRGWFDSPQLSTDYTNPVFSYHTGQYTAISGRRWTRATSIVHREFAMYTLTRAQKGPGSNRSRDAVPIVLLFTKQQNW